MLSRQTEPQRAIRRILLVLSVLGVLFLAGCGGSGSSSGTTYWSITFTDGSSLYMSLTIQGDNAAGWAKYGDGSWSHFTGIKNSDGTFDVGAYSGSTLSIDGNELTETERAATHHWSKIDENAYKAAGGP